MKRIFATATLSLTALGLAACSDNAQTSETEVTAPTSAASTGTESTAQAPAAGVLDANSATTEQLAATDGISAELAAAVVAGRPYASATAFNAKLLETLTPQQAEAVRTKVFVPVNLNTASEADIKLIPGMTPKMVHEFMEYRPYADMGVFDREIGKYVDAAEVARFRNYVTL